MSQLESCIRFWESKLNDKGLFEPSTMEQIESTIRFLRLGLEMPNFPDTLAKEKKQPAT